MVAFSSFSELNNILVCVCVCVVYAYHIVFFHSYIDRQLDCFPALAIVITEFQLPRTPMYSGIRKLLLGLEAGLGCASQLEKIPY